MMWETGLYYLQSRYYDPETGRFLNADNIVTLDSDLTGINVFSYCGGNPVNRSDPTGHAWSGIARDIINVTFGIFWFSYAIGYRKVSDNNYQKNSKVDSNSSTTTKNKLINDQNGKTGKNFEYGLYKASHNACETIAVHNAKVLKGIDSTLSYTMVSFQTSGAMIGYGYFGSMPQAIGNVLKNEGIAYERVGLSEITQPGVYIISFWNSDSIFKGLHTVALQYNGYEYEIYNYKSLRDNGTYEPSKRLNLSEFEGRYICGYYLY